MSNQKIVIVKGSPRKKENSNILAESLAKGAKDNNAEVEKFYSRKYVGLPRFMILSNTFFDQIIIGFLEHGCLNIL